MPNDLLKPDNEMGWYKGRGSDDPKYDDLEKSYNADNSGYNSADPKSKATPKKSFDGDALRDKESAGGGFAPSLTPSLNEQARASGQALGAALNSTPMGRFARAAFVIKNNKGKTAGIGGAIFTILFAAFGFFSAGLEAVNVKENFAGRGSLSSNFSLKKRGVKSLTKIAEAFKANDLTGVFSDLEKINSAELINRFEQAGITVAKDAETGAVTSISKQLSTGETIAIDYVKNGATATAEDISKQAAVFVEVGGQELATSLEKVNSSVIGRWLGPAGRSLIKDRLGSALDSVANKFKPDDPAKTPEENARETAVQAETPDANVNSEVTPNGVEATATDKNGNTVDATTGEPAAAADVNAAVNEAGSSVSRETAEAASTALDNVATAGAEATAKSFSDIAKSIVGSTASSVALSTVNYSQGLQVACTAIGTIQFIANVRNILFTVELARFAYRYLNAADSQKAGILLKDGTKLLRFMHMGSGSYTSAPGLLFAMGDRSQVVSNKSRTAFSGGRESAGNFGKLDSFISNTAGLNGEARKKTCKTVNNGWFQLGAIVVSVGITALTLGAGAELSVDANAIIIGGMQAALSIALAIGGPMLASAGKHFIIADIKESFMKGDGLGAGLGALRSMNESSSSLLITPKSVSTALRLAALEDYKQTNKSKSIFSRYFSPTNGESLTAQIAMALPSKTQSFVNGSFFTNGNPLNIDNAVASITKLAGGNAYAATNSQCTDEALAKYETDPFCFSENSIAPDLDIQETYNLLLNSNNINQDGSPVTGSDYAKFIDRCASGQPTLVYNTNVKKDGSDDSVVTTCTDDKLALKGETTPYSQAFAYIYNNQPKQSLFAKLMGQRAYAAPQDATVVSQRMRFAAWKGYMVDKANLIDSFISTGSTTNTNTVPSVVFGDTSNVPCGAGTDLGVNDGYKNGVLYKIRLCELPGNLRVNSQLSKGISDMIAAAKSAGLSIGATDSYRSMDVQRAGFHQRCGADYPESQPYQKPPCTGAPIARPGYSNHQMGLALDLTCNGSGVPQTYDLAKNNPCFQWMTAHASAYGLFEYGLGKATSRASDYYEGWHWSADGN